MKYKGLNRDVPNSEMPEGFGVDARNGINSKLLGASINEGGFKAFQKVGSSNKYALKVTISGIDYYRKQCGEVQLDLDRFLICSVAYNTSVNPSFSEIGILEEDGRYITIIRDFTFNAEDKLNFSLEHPYTGDYTKNYLNETIVALTDYNNRPLLLNIDTYITTPAISGTLNINKLLMFPSISNPDTVVTSISDNGGNLENGVYYLVYKYYTEDFALTNGLMPTNPITIYNAPLGNTTISIDNVEGDLENKTTSKAINIQLYDVNTSFTGIKVYAVIKKQGQFFGRELKDIKIANQVNLTFTISSSEGIDVDYKSLITPSITFSKVYGFTQVVKRLYAARPKVNEFRALQTVANKVRIKWTAKRNTGLTTGASSPAKKEFNHDTKTFAPREVYAFYLHAELTDGTITEGFHIPALSNLTEAQIISGGYRTASTEAAAQGITAAKYKVEDTCTITNPTDAAGATGEMGLWENQETYPNLPEYEDFAGKPIRHHRFPSINFFRENTCFNISPSSNNQLGITWLPDLGIRVENVNIPIGIQPFIKSWFVTYAKRTYNNSTVIGMSTIGFESTKRNQQVDEDFYPKAWYSGFNSEMDGYVDSVASPTLNYSNVIPYTPFTLNRGVSGNPPIVTTNKALVRFQDYGLVKNKPDINPVFIANELFLKTDIETIEINTNNAPGKRATMVYDYTKKAFSGQNQESFKTSDLAVPNTTGSGINPGSPIATIPLNSRIRKLNSYAYIVENSVTPDFNNQWLEDTLILDVDCTVDGGNTVLHAKTFPINVIQQMGTAFYPNTSNWKTATDFFGLQETYLSSLMNLPLDVYNDLFNQDLVNTAQYYDVTATSTTAIYKGDCFNALSSYHTTGWGSIPSNRLTTGSNGENFAGVRALWIHLTTTPINLALRTSSITDVSQQFYPKNPVDYHRNINTYTIQSAKQYNNDYSSINDIKPLLCYNPFVKTLVENLYRINRTIAEQSESTDIGWRTWLANDYYEVPRNKGAITNIQGMDRNLIINTENTLYITVGNEQLNVGNATAFIGAGNIFERPAMEYAPSKEGSMGTRDRFSCLLTAFGYVFVDRKKGTIILLGESPAIISNNGMTRWLFENLDFTTTITVANRTVEIPANPYAGFGIHCGMDYEFNRLLITKKYYELTALGLEYLNNNSGNRLRFENNVWVLYSATGVKVEVGYDNSTYFINKSFTLSYYLAGNTFTFFHDYYPNRYMVRRQSIIAVSSKLINAVLPFNYSSNHFIMNQVNKGVYENVDTIDVDNPLTQTSPAYSFYIVPVIAARTTRTELLDLKIQTDCVKAVLKGIGTEERYQKEHPTTILVFNTYQSTPIITLVPTTDLSTFFSSNTRLIKGMWTFSKLKDWLATNVYNSGQAFIIDYSKLDVSKIDLNKPTYNITPLVDQWFAVKITYANLDLQLPKEFRILQVEFSLLPVSR